MAWARIQHINVEQIVADNDIPVLEDVIDALLACNIVAEDPYSLCMHDYLQILQPLQLALEYTWALYSKRSGMHGTTARCLTAASAFRNALQRYSMAAHGDSEKLSQSQISSDTSLRSEQLRAQLRPLKKLHEAMRAILKAEVAHDQTSRFVFRSRCKAIDWAALQSVSTSSVEDNEGLGLLCSVLPILAYGDISREPWQELRANDCINFIQLAQRALQYMLSQADAAHAKLQEARQQLHQQEAAIKRLHQRSRDCFPQLKQVQATHRLPWRTDPLPDEAQMADAQPVPPGLPMQRTTQEASIEASKSQLRQPRSTSPVKGSQVRYRASTDAPVLVQGFIPDAASIVQCEQQVAAGMQEASAGQDISNHEQARDLSMPSETGVTHVTRELETSLRHEQRQLHEARSQVADLWTAIGSFGQETVFEVHEASSAPTINWEADSAGIPGSTHSPHKHITSVSLDLEALRAAERRHAEAQIRSSFADIKQRAFQDITQRMNRSSDERTSGQQQDSFSNALSGMQPFQSTPKHAGMMQQPIQHFSTAAPVSQMVSHLRSSNGMERASSPTLPRLFTSARPPKARGFHVQSTSHSSASLQQVQGQQKDMHRLQKVPMSMCDASLMSNKLMRLTSCVKLNKADL